MMATDTMLSRDGFPMERRHLPLPAPLSLPLAGSVDRSVDAACVAVAASADDDDDASIAATVNDACLIAVA